MKKVSITTLVLALLSVTLTSKKCSDEDIPAPSYLVRQIPTFEELEAGGPPCPNQGEGCVIAKPQLPFATIERLSEGLNTFNSALNNNTLTSYFNDASSYQDIFPNLSDSRYSNTLVGLKNGSIKADYIGKATIAIFDGNSPNDGNIKFVVYVDTTTTP